jgi:long-chain acyl-CoA synthetase
MFELAAIAARTPQNVAIRGAGGTVSYADLADRVRARSTDLLDSGLRAGDRVILGCATEIETVVNAVALLERRCLVLPVAVAAPAETLRKSRACFEPSWEVRGRRVVRAAATAPPPETHPTSALQALLSSGSTGSPKIVLRSAEQVSAGVRIMVTAIGLESADRILALVPFEHSFGFNSVMLAALSVGAEIVFPTSPHPRGIAREVEENRVTMLPAPPHFLDLMHRFAGAGAAVMSRIRACLTVGDILPRATYEGFVDSFGVPVWQSYGASEAGPVLLNQSGAFDGDRMALGRPYPEVSVELCDPRGEALPDGRAGEIVVRSPAVGLGYLGEDDGGTRISGDRCFTGDLAVRRNGGFSFAGRTKSFIARAGRKVDPAEVEQVLREHPDVVDAAVHAESADAPLRALVVTRRPLRREDLIARCARSLPPYKVPRIIEFRSELPRDALGKLQRGRL